MELTYEWKADFAIILASLSFLATLLKWFIDAQRVRKVERVKAYETVYSDACFILVSPLRQKRKAVKEKHYTHDNPYVQKAVREYLSLALTKPLPSSRRLVCTKRLFGFRR